MIALAIVSAIFVVMSVFCLRDIWPKRYQHSHPLTPFQWTRRLARRGDAKAWADCATMLEKGIGGAPRNPHLAKTYRERALDIYRPKARNGDGLAWLKMAEIYNSTHKGPGFDDKADRCYHRAWKIHVQQAEDGDPKGMAYAGYQYRFGLGTIADLERAAHYLEGAARAGHAPSIKSLADLYAMGFKSKPDPIKAAQLYRLAAMKGDVESLERVGDNYFGNLGENTSRELAYFWYSHALRKGREAARDKLRWLEEQWTPKQLRDVQDRLRDWAPS
ncbi:tetratricopeptide repeat protein [Asticcacaulis sp. 201]|uniref:tetratricopeptide repeat protein n=1 Tax=Asticcacaulis sp. 201 TaxID=3028787 RepID=UPI00291600DF|nr:tetratricopeptide repeat protein [Asticcacaulis sp. 201]MDV6332020.1 tetratricopeptide repeat protein [Asticcacaulis sp. 201]